MSQTKNYKTEVFEIIVQIQLTTLLKNDECNLENTNPHEKRGNFKMLKVHTADTLINQHKPKCIFTICTYTHR